MEQALKEEGQGATIDSIKNEGRKPDCLRKMDQATKLMEGMWSDLQECNVKRRDVIRRFMEEFKLSAVGSTRKYPLLTEIGVHCSGTVKSDYALPEGITRLVDCISA